MSTDRIAVICCFQSQKNQGMEKETMETQANSKQIKEDQYMMLYANSIPQCTAEAKEQPISSYTDNNKLCIVSDFLSNHGLYPHLLGYRYLRSALLHAMADPTFFDNLSRVCYPQLAREFHTNERCVERAIRHALGRATDSDQCIIPQPDRCSNREFMVRASEYIQLHLR